MYELIFSGGRDRIDQTLAEVEALCVAFALFVVSLFEAKHLAVAQKQKDASPDHKIKTVLCSDRSRKSKRGSLIFRADIKISLNRLDLKKWSQKLLLRRYFR